MGNRLILSEDGTHTLSSEKYGVTYHSIYGSLNESITVFLSAGLQYHLLRGKTEISVFEMGLGTGLNALLTMVEADRNGTQVDYHAIELYPIDIHTAEQLNYIDHLGLSEYANQYREIHISEADAKCTITPHFNFTKYFDDIISIEIKDSFDVIYYDAFAPTAQEELWTPALMAKLYRHTNPGGVLVTYCAKGSFKRALKSAGYEVEALPGPPGKREMTRAIKVL